jgi:ABC-2 type transport system ATP-binding protein
MGAVALDRVRKTYSNGEVVAVDDVSLTVNEGELFGLIGPDGAGKTSLFRMLTTLLLPDAGTGSVAGYDIVRDFKQIRNTVGYMPGKFSLYPDLTIEENLHFFATVFGTTIQENYDLIRDIYVQIEPFKNRRAGKLSGGMKQKLALCCALIHKPTVLFLDEPTTGVDTVSRKEFWEMLKRLKQQGITILVSTPYMDEATMCERIALIQGGKILSVDSPENIIRSYPEKLFAVRSAKLYSLLRDLQAYGATFSVFTFGEYLHVSFREPADRAMADALVYLKEKGHEQVEIHPIEPSIEDCFIRLLKG